MKCPACGGFLSTKKYETEQIDQCNRCQGVWLDWGEVVNIIKSRDEKISHKVKTKVLALKGQDHRNNTEIKCPKCSKTMDTFEYAFNSGVIVDKCPDKHGLWLDGRELEKIQAIFEMIDLKTGVSYENDDELKSKKFSRFHVSFSNYFPATNLNLVAEGPRTNIKFRFPCELKSYSTLKDEFELI